jgi:hypothetical protein
VQRKDVISMAKFWSRSSRLEHRLREERPAPRDEFVSMLSERVRESRPAPRARMRVAFAGALTMSMLMVLAAFGGMGYAASGVKRAVTAVAAIAAPSHTAGPAVSAAADQYGQPAAYKKQCLAKANSTLKLSLTRASRTYLTALKKAKTDKAKLAVARTFSKAIVKAAAVHKAAVKKCG